MMPKFFEVIVQIELGEFVLQMHSEVHIFNTMNDDIDELHASNLEKVHF